jgi:outer membrane receptor protein involved in Fe transport
MQLSASGRHRALGRDAARAAALLAMILLTATNAQGAPEVEEEQGEQVVAQADAAEPAPEPQPPKSREAEGASEEAAPGIEVMHIKGRGVGQIETEVQSSVTQFDASTIEALGAQNITDLARVTPNVNIVQPGATQATFFVRGIGLSDFSSNAAGAVTILQDDVAINAAPIQTGQLFDVETVDIVRGPQGTGHFRNASAGAFQIRSKRPTGNYGAQLRSSLGEYRTKGDKGARHALFQDYEGALEMPIVADSLSARFAFRLREGEPYKTNNCGYSIPFDQRLGRSNDVNQLRRANSQMCGEGESPNVVWPNTRPASVSQIPFPLPYSVGDEHNWAARGTLRFQPKDTDLEFFLNGHGSRLAQDSTLGQVVGTKTYQGSGNQGSQNSYGQSSSLGYREKDALEEFNYICQLGADGRCSNQYTNTILSKKIATRPLDRRPYRGDYNRVGDETRDAYGAFVSGQGPIADDVSLFVLSSFDQYQRTTDNDTDFTPDRLFEIMQEDRAWQLWNEVRLEGELPFEPIEWNVGAYNLREQLDNNGVLLIGLGQKVDIDRKYSQDIDSWGAWGEFSWDFADDFTLEGGVRYNYEKKDFNINIVRWQYSQTAPFLPPTSPLLPGPAFIGSNKSSKTWQTPTGQITLTYHMDAASQLYAKYSRGFKAGHFNALATENLNDPPAEAEYNDAWEVGLRGGFFGGLMSLGAAGFYYRYENYQVFLFSDSASSASPPVLEILNAKQAENFGIEVEGQIAPLRGWTPRLIEGLRISGNFGWLHGEYLDFVTTRFLLAGNALTPVPVDYSGLTLQNAPEFKASGTIEWTFDLGRFGYVVPRYDINWTDDVFFDPNEGHGSKNLAMQNVLPDFAIGQKQYYLHNVRLAYRTPTGNVEIAGWIRNIDDRVYKNYAFDASFFTNVTINFPGTPRTIGMDVIVTF